MTYEEFIFDLKKKYPNFQIKLKSQSKLMKLVAWLFLILTFGKFKRNDFMNGFVTTIKYTIYVPDFWGRLASNIKFPILVHEAKHIEQYEKEKIWFIIKYLFLPLPFGWAMFRLNYEAEAYASEIIHNYLTYNFFLYGIRYETAIKELTGSSYFWTCFNKNVVRRKLKREIVKALLEKK